MMDSFVMYQVGTCDPGLAMRKDCCLLQFFEGIPHVYVLIDRPTEEMLQRANFEKATIEFGLFAHKDVMTLAIKVGDLPWIDAPYSAHLEHGENLPMWNAKNLQVNRLLVDSFDGRILGIRMILKADGWHLSPLYDVNPVPEGDELSLCVNEDDATISLDLALEIAPYCGINAKDAKTLAAEILKTVRDNWNRLATECGLSRSAQEYMCPAFSLALEK